MKNILNHHLYKAIAIGEIFLFLILWVFQPSPILPSLCDVFSAFLRLVTEQELLKELFTSMSVCLIALLYSFVISLSLAYLSQVKFGTKKIKVIEPIVFMLTKFRFMTLVGLGFVFTLYTPNSYILKIAMLTFGMTVFYITSVYDIVSKVEKHEYIHARTLGMSEIYVLWEVIILGKFHLVYEAMIQSFAILWSMITLVEGVVRSQGGIGTLLLNENKSLHLDGIFAIQLLILFTGLGLDYLFKLIGEMIMPYSNLSTTK